MTNEPRLTEPGPRFRSLRSVRSFEIAWARATSERASVVPISSTLFTDPFPARILADESALLGLSPRHS
ncbi:MAG: hypothetical protein AUK47_13205 [Deltaproteobacteria bacterium CG2_30_63_29]|nr:MAG: hypothetical protein AUK47_13205 [Deltaproteobacteria bacterium CG2_30_63_29]PIW01833.1 MAG: hypothetical protein COW42_03640 [Deltaproteobacteria bacterium CG17_big_fil_post_rev_8_21_14_2_50_63_7]PJB38923.1 MAG: hypothetical protein CO108_18250 [Deltaproteobacteria bacterium CG_4_9_14_3_um_filter_63_12]